MSADRELRAVLLGSSAVCTAEREYTSLAIQERGGVLLFDCGGNPIRNILRAGMNPEDLRTVLVTHHHTDHVSGLPIILHEMMLRGMRGPLQLYCPKQSEPRLRAIVDCYFGDERPDLRIRPVEASQDSAITECNEWRIFGTNADHYGITLAYKFVSRQDGRALVYAPDTRPYEDLARFSKSADVLLHDCTYPDGFEREAWESHHSTASQAGQIASIARVKKLVLVHLGSDCVGRAGQLLNSAEKEFAGQILLGYDLLTV